MRMAVLAIIAALAALALALWLVLRRRRRQRQQGIFVRFDTMFGPMRIYTVTRSNGRLARVMDIEGAFQSATYLDDDCYELVFDYYKMYDVMFDTSAPLNNVLVLGGGGYAYPKHLISTYDDMHVDVVEIDEAVTRIAQRYFYLDRLIVEFDTEATGQLDLICDDARRFVDTTPNRYGAIVNDCFAGRSPAMSLATIEAARAIHDHLEPGGLYLTNVIASLEGPESTFLRNCVATLGQHFAHVHVIAGAPHNRRVRDNNIVVASDAPYTFAQAVAFDCSGATIMTDAGLESGAVEAPVFADA